MVMSCCFDELYDLSPFLLTGTAGSDIFASTLVFFLTAARVFDSFVCLPKSSIHIIREETLISLSRYSDSNLPIMSQVII